MADVALETGYADFMRSDQDVVMGHEFCGEIVEHGPSCRRSVPTGTTVVSLPLLRVGKDIHATGLSVAAPVPMRSRCSCRSLSPFPCPMASRPESPC